MSASLWWEALLTAQVYIVASCTASALFTERLILSIAVKAFWPFVCLFIFIFFLLLGLKHWPWSTGILPSTRNSSYKVFSCKKCWPLRNCTFPAGKPQWPHNMRRKWLKIQQLVAAGTGVAFSLWGSRLVYNISAEDPHIWEYGGSTLDSTVLYFLKEDTKLDG